MRPVFTVLNEDLTTAETITPYYAHRYLGDHMYLVFSDMPTTVRIPVGGGYKITTRKEET